MCMPKTWNRTASLVPHPGHVNWERHKVKYFKRCVLQDLKIKALQNSYKIRLAALKY